MKRTKQLFLFCFMLIMLTVTTLAVADAVTVNRYLLKNKSGELWEDETVSYNFNMPVDKNVVIHFYEDSDDYYEDEGTYGNINMTLKDSDGNVAYSVVDFAYGEKKYNVDLKAGDYTLYLTTGETEDLEYLFSVYYVDDASTTNVSLDKTSLHITKGSSATLKATITPSDSAEKLTWTSSNTSVATVDSKGKITAKAMGKSKITAKSGSKSASCVVTVDKSSVDIYKGKTLALSTYVKYISDYKNGKWSSSNTSVATVNSTGTVTGKSNGVCSIYFKAKDGTKYTIVLNVYNSTKCYLIKNAYGELKKGASKSYSFTMPADGKTTLYFYGFYEDYNDSSDIEYTYGDCIIKVTDSQGKTVYSKEKSISFDSTSLTFSLKKGKYKLTIKENDDFNFSYRMSLYFVTKATIKTTKLSVSKTSLVLSKGSSSTLIATVSPTYSTDELKWTSSNSSVASVSSSGKVTAKALGKATITVRSGSKTASCKVTVNKATVSVLKNKTLSLSAYVKHIANYKTGTWSSSNTSVAYVNSAGTVTGRSSGSSTITFKTKDGARYTFALTVKNLVTAKVVRVYDDDIYNDCYIEFTNNTKKDITYITLNITQYDNRGYRLSSPYDYYYLNETIKAGKKAEYYFWVNDNTKSANVKITKVWFSDGTTYVP